MVPACVAHALRARVGRAAVLVGGGVLVIVLAGGDPREVARDPALIAYVAPMAAWIVLEQALLREGEAPRYRGRLTTRLAQLAVFAALLVAALDHYRWRFSPLPAAPATYATGAVVIAAGAALRLWAIRTLDLHFRYELRVDADQPLVTRGPYGVVRHPSYSGIVVIAMGGGFAFASLAGAAVGLAATVAVFIARIREEERVLEEGFGDAYIAYRARTWKLVPFVY